MNMTCLVIRLVEKTERMTGLALYTNQTFGITHVLRSYRMTSPLNKLSMLANDVLTDNMM